MSGESMLRTGYTTGTCAAAAAQAAAMLLVCGTVGKEISTPLPAGEVVVLPVLYCGKGYNCAWAAVEKNAGDDPDMTDGVAVEVLVSACEGIDLKFEAGKGVGTITKPGLAFPPGEPAINPVPRQMITHAIRQVTKQGLRVVVSIPGGEKIAEKTFNPRLGIVGGLSILGTSGIVRPFSHPALLDAIKCSMGVAKACGVTSPVLVPGRIGEKAAGKYFILASEQIIEVSNLWGSILKEIPNYGFERILALGHPGKLAKLASGNWDTHSARSHSALPWLQALADDMSICSDSRSVTVEGFLRGLPEHDMKILGQRIATEIRVSIEDYLSSQTGVSVILVDLSRNIIGISGDLQHWQRRSQ
jgi:cobalt-precorrin-5B (C1)-methyltransferase